MSSDHRLNELDRRIASAFRRHLSDAGSLTMPPVRRLWAYERWVIVLHRIRDALLYPFRPQAVVVEWWMATPSSSDFVHTVIMVSRESLFGKTVIKYLHNGEQIIRFDAGVSWRDFWAKVVAPMPLVEDVSEKELYVGDDDDDNDLVPESLDDLSCDHAD